MTVANQISLARLASIPALLFCIASYERDAQAYRWAALALFTAAALSDALDGYIARRFGQQSKLGRVLDPLADKLLINLTLVFLAVNPAFAEPVPYWFPVIILARDTFIVIGARVINDYFKPLRVRPRIGGKATTIVQISAIIAVLLELPIAFPLMILTLAVSALSLIDYAVAETLEARRKDAAS